MISEQDKKAILDGVLARTNNNKKAKFILKSEHEANFNYPYLFLISDKDKCYTDWYNEHLNSKQDKFNSSIVELWQDEPEPFDIERALNGEPVRLRDGKKAYIFCDVPSIPEFNHNPRYSLLGLIEKTSSYSAWTRDGKVSVLGGQLPGDIIGMWKKPEPVSNTVTLTLPCPLKEPREGMWFLGFGGGIFKSNFDVNNSMDTYNDIKLDTGLYFKSEEDAKAWLDAMRDNRR